MKAKALQTALAASILGAALVGGHWFVHFLAGTLGWGSPPKVELASEPGPLPLRSPVTPVAPDLAPAVASDAPSRADTAPDASPDPEPAEAVADEGETEIARRTPAFDGDLALFSANQGRGEPSVNPNTFVVNADPSLSAGESESPSESPTAGGSPDAGDSDQGGPGAGDDRRPSDEDRRPAQPVSLDAEILANADAATEVAGVAASASARISTKPAADAELAASTGVANLLIEAGSEADPAESGEAAASGPQSGGLVDNALAGSVSGLIGGVAPPASASGTRVQVRQDNRVLIGPGSLSLDPLAPEAPSVATRPAAAGPSPSVPAALAPGPRPPAPAAGSFPQGGGAANAGIDLPAGIGANAGPSGVGINAGRLGIRIDAGLR